MVPVLVLVLVQSAVSDPCLWVGTAVWGRNQNCVTQLFLESGSNGLERLRGCWVPASICWSVSPDEGVCVLQRASLPLRYLHTLSCLLPRVECFACCCYLIIHSLPPNMTDVLCENKMSNKIQRARCRLVKLSGLVRCSL